MGRFYLLFGICVCLGNTIDLAAGYPGRWNCVLKKFLECAQWVDFMESFSGMKADITCPTLRGAFDCVYNLWESCGYSCSKEEALYDTTHAACPVHSQTYVISPKITHAIKNPCSVYQTLELCNVTKCGEDRIDNSWPNLDKLDFSEQELMGIQEAKNCTQFPIKKFVKKHEDDVVGKETCKQIRESWQAFQKHLAEEFPTISTCAASKVQEMSLVVAAAGMRRLVETCDRRAPVTTTSTPEEHTTDGDNNNEANNLPHSLVTTMSFVVASYAFINHPQSLVF